MLNSIRLGSRVVDSLSKPYVIAEIGVNHEGSMDQAKRLIDLARQGGADAAKFQSYKAGTLASKHSPSYWDTTKEPTRSQYALFQKYDNFGPDEYRALAEHCRQTGIDFLSTPFDDEAIEFLDPLVPFFKIASADLTNIPFLRKVAAKGKPVVLSTGASTLGEVDVAVEALTQAGCADIALLHCILNYPTDNANAHLRMIEGLKRAYPRNIIGYSDHTLPDDAMTSLVAAHLLGAVIIEKHFTHDKALPGNDHYHAMDQHDLARFVALAETVHVLLGPTDHKAPIATEAISRKNARRSIVLARDVTAGQRLTAADLTYKRPGTGVSPMHWDEVLNRCAAAALQADHVLQWQDLAPASE
ncbi:acetylneuraminic acid synthetase [Sulfuritalea hydrogenivorans sk43H]|uniref:Acetylneuraminic acid synthetase n=2 Tax=Sulfuritalea hydrogenivorans TaxID=748811 RepID=W0SK01_9PROT|nr:acetylneuraminic acid synthetase [Sulfuritalea hydrogenivorans sk43H]